MNSFDVFFIKGFTVIKWVKWYRYASDMYIFIWRGDNYDI